MAASGAAAPKVKTAQKVAAIITKYSLVSDPAPVNGSEIGADPWNRNGARPNIQVVTSCPHTFTNATRPRPPTHHHSIHACR